MEINFQYAIQKNAYPLPLEEKLLQWITITLADQHANNAEMTVRIVGNNEMSTLNYQFRRKRGPTNVLSFPADLPEGIDMPLLGDIVICADVVEHEALAQHKTLDAHWAHLVIHGILHLLGYDHTDGTTAQRMETLEITLLARLGFENPYLLANHS